ncbi:MAG: hypothetical protein EXS09_04030 [Gemmataceae bacterium]|nr:hypothetical protein [Gemmataceae bacterium]
MDCNTTRMLATFFGRHNSELAPEDASALTAHIASCSRCAAEVQFERAFDNRVAQAMLAVPFPAGLKAKLFDGIATQHGSWYRQKAYYAVGMAASLLIAIGGVVAWQMGTAPELTLAEIVAQSDRQEQNRSGNVRKFLKERGLGFDPERQLDLNQVEFWGDGELSGKKVPVLNLVNNAKNARAKVYIVRTTDFDWKKLPQDGSSVASVYGFQVVVMRDTKRLDVAYIVVFTGASLEMFLEDRSSL